MTSDRSAPASDARALFVQYEGSRFQLWREGRLAEYEAHQVPAEVEAEWLQQLTEQHLHELPGATGWWSVYFLLMHGDLSRLPAVVAAAPTEGRPWQRRAFLEHALEYWDACAGWDRRAGRLQETGRDHSEELDQALRWIRDQAEELSSSYRMRGQRAQLQKVVAAASLRLGQVG